MALKIFNSVAKRIKVKVRKFFGLTPTFAEVTGEKVGRGDMVKPKSYLIAFV